MLAAQPLAKIQVGLADSLHAEPLLALVLLFLAGLLTSLTPCLYPMIPITAGIISGSAAEDASRARVIGLTLAYVSGLALLYSVAGLIAGLTGTLFGTIAASVPARLVTAILLAMFGLALLDRIPVRVPRRLASWAGRLEGGSYPAALLLGASSGIVAAPCGAPAFAAVLTWVATTRSGGLGFLYLLSFSLGMTALLVLVGLFSGFVDLLPKGHRWTRWSKHAGGSLLLGMSAYYIWQAWRVW